MSELSADLASYKRGRRLADWWISIGGELDVDGPYFGREALYDGFVDRLAEARAAAAIRTEPQPDLGLALA